MAPYLKPEIPFKQKPIILEKPIRQTFGSVPSLKLTVRPWKSPSFLGFIPSKWWIFQPAMLVYRRVSRFFFFRQVRLWNFLGLWCLALHLRDHALTRTWQSSWTLHRGDWLVKDGEGGLLIGNPYNGYLEPVNVLYFGASTLQKKALFNQNKGHLGSRYINPYGIGLMSLSPIIWKQWEWIDPIAHVNVGWFHKGP